MDDAGFALDCRVVTFRLESTSSLMGHRDSMLPETDVVDVA